MRYITEFLISFRGSISSASWGFLLCSYAFDLLHMNSSDKVAKHTKDWLKFLRSKHKTRPNFVQPIQGKRKQIAAAAAPGSQFYDLSSINPEVLIEQFVFSATCFTILATALWCWRVQSTSCRKYCATFVFRTVCKILNGTDTPNIEDCKMSHSEAGFLSWIWTWNTANKMEGNYIYTGSAPRELSSMNALS